jgi:hypothetical protein
MINDPIPFLANVIAIAHSDGKLSPGELAQLEVVRSEFGFKKTDLIRATKLVEQGGYIPTLIGSFSDQIKNLECILRVAYADDELEQIESELIGSFCQKIGIYQDQLDKLVSEVLAALSDGGKLCPKCGSSAASDAQFCPKCGTAISVIQEAVSLDFTIPSSGIAVEFADSSAASFHKALEIAKTSDHYQICQRMKKTWHLAVFNTGSMKDVLPLAESLSGVRNKKVFLNGCESSWDELFGFTWCAAQRATAYRPMEYCFGKDDNRINPWGCKQARLDWVEWGDWFSYGRWEKAGGMGPKFLWHFDKERIRHELATRMYRFRFCPHVDIRLAEVVLRLLPDHVAPENDKNWKYHKNFEEVPGSIKIVERQGTGDYAYTDEFWADGVRPVGHRVLDEILSQAFKELGISQITVSALLK